MVDRREVKDEVALMARHKERDIDPLAALLADHGVGLNDWDTSNAAQRYHARLMAASMTDLGVEVLVPVGVDPIPLDDSEDSKLRGILFNDITRADLNVRIHFSDRRDLTDYLWQQGWRREAREEDINDRSRG